MFIGKQPTVDTFSLEPNVQGVEVYTYIDIYTRVHNVAQ